MFMQILVDDYVICDYVSFLQQESSTHVQPTQQKAEPAQREMKLDFH